jgi:hypothetical protein
MGEAGYRTVVDRFSIDAMVRRIQEVYEEELARSGANAAVRSGLTRPEERTRAPSGRAALEVPPL